MIGRIHHILSLGIVVLVVLATVPSAWALEPRPLPSFQVTTRDGVSVPSEQLSVSGRWLLVYVRPHCVACDALLHLLKKDARPTVSDHLIVIVGGRPKDAKQEVLRFPDLIEATWYLDTYQEAFQHLGLHGVPVVMGVKNGIMEWQASGIPAEAQELNSVVQAWLAGQ